MKEIEKRLEEQERRRMRQNGGYKFAAKWDDGPCYLLGTLGNVADCTSEEQAKALGLPVIDPDADTDGTVILWHYVAGPQPGVVVP